MTLFLVMYVGAGLMFAGMAIPLIQRRIKPNAWYGFRVPKTLSDPEAWYAVNAYAGKYLLGVGLLTIFMALMLYFWPGITEETYAVACTVILLAGLLVNLIQGFRFLGNYGKNP